ncbi:hypothetical protein [Streptomyces parvulus]|uniref:hypothetical protein n=1 Tax=Streptomyces parvulus TaxID=146923 RepID=UPI0033ACAA95
MNFFKKIIGRLLEGHEASGMAISASSAFQGNQFTIRIAPTDPAFTALHQALSETPLRQDIEAVARIHRFITRSKPAPTMGDLWSALFSEGLTERIPLSPDLTNPALITVAIFQHLEMRVADEEPLGSEIRTMQGEVAEALRTEILNALDATTVERTRRIVKGQRLGPEEIENVAPAAEETIDHTLARLFLRLGPPPEANELDYTPAGRGGGGAQQ